MGARIHNPKVGGSIPPPATNHSLAVVITKNPILPAGKKIHGPIDSAVLSSSSHSLTAWCLKQLEARLMGTTPTPLHVQEWGILVEAYSTQAALRS
jgi:hypothetical protein